MPVITITKDNFQKEVLESGAPILLDFWAEWCGHCRSVAPVLEALAAEQDGLRIGKIDVDRETELAEKFQVRSIPLLVVMKDGKAVRKQAGAQSKSQIKSMLEHI